MISDGEKPAADTSSIDRFLSRVRTLSDDELGEVYAVYCARESEYREPGIGYLLGAASLAGFDKEFEAAVDGALATAEELSGRQGYSIAWLLDALIGAVAVVLLRSVRPELIAKLYMPFAEVIPLESLGPPPARPARISAPAQQHGRA